jgi:branched-chain amino acid transport system permease protein
VTANQLVLIALNGISYGLMLFMLASGLTLILSLLGVLNFAHGAFYMLGAYLGFQFSVWFGFWPALLLAPLAVGALGVLVQRYGLREVHRQGYAAELLFTFGLAYVIVEAVPLLWGRAPLAYVAAAELEGPVRWLQSMGIVFPRYRAFMMAVACVLLGALVLIARSRLGWLIKALRNEPTQLEALGYNVPRLMTLIFGLGCAMAGLAGAVGGVAFVTEPGMAASISAIVFVIVVAGGIGSLPGALLVALALGLIDTAGKASDWPIGVAGLTVADLTPLLPFALLLAVLWLRPRGLLGAEEAP